jgi:hypothetical protein
LRRDTLESPKTLRVSLPALTAEQAECVFHFLSALADPFFSPYERPLVDLKLAASLSSPDDFDYHDPNQPPEDDDDYYFPF